MRRKVRKLLGNNQGGCRGLKQGFFRSSQGAWTLKHPQPRLGPWAPRPVAVHLGWTSKSKRAKVPQSPLPQSAKHRHSQPVCAPPQVRQSDSCAD